MAQQVRTGNRPLVEVAVPSGWDRPAQVRNGLALELLGPRDSHGQRARLQVLVTSIDPEPIQCVAFGIVEEISRCLPDRVLAACDLWPHPVWGMGRIIQTAHVDAAGRAMAHDTYLFVHDECRVTIDIDYAVEELFIIEDDIATIVASARPVAVTDPA